MEKVQPLDGACAVTEGLHVTVESSPSWRYFLDYAAESLDIDI